MKTELGIPISPRAFRALRLRSLSAAEVSGTGPNGRIIESDVLHTASSLRGPSDKPRGTLSSMRRAVAAKVAESFATVPHFYLRSQVDATSLVQLREQNLETFEKCLGVRPSLTDFMLKAIALALREHPQANSIWHEGTIVPLQSIDIGLVVQTGDGLMVPILRNADRLSLGELSHRRQASAEAIRSGKSSADIFQGGATSLTNLGKRRVDEFTPIISPPQSSMLAMGRLAERPTVHAGKLCIRQTIHLTLAVDHRVMDGLPAAAYFDRIVELLENPFLLFCEMSVS